MASYIFMAITAAVMTPVALVLIRNILVAYSGWEVAGQWQAYGKFRKFIWGNYNRF
jgi:PST family polysaccharide transporter